MLIEGLDISENCRLGDKEQKPIPAPSEVMSEKLLVQEEEKRLLLLKI